MKKEYNNFHILKAIEADASVSQRALSFQMELNVASVNFALKNLIRNGYVIKSGENQRRTKYNITPEGLRQKVHLAYKFYFQNTPYYKEVRRDLAVRIINAVNGRETDIAIYGTSEFSRIVYLVILKMRLNFTGFFLDDLKFRNQKILGFEVQELKQLNRKQKCLLLLAENFPSYIIDDMEEMNVDTLNLID